MERHRLFVGVSAMVTLSVTLAYFAEVHRPFSETSHPFALAYLAIFATLTAIILLTRWFSQGVR